MNGIYGAIGLILFFHLCVFGGKVHITINDVVYRIGVEIVALGK